MTASACRLFEQDGIVVLALNGDIDVSNVPVITSSVRDRLASGYPGLVVDLSMVRYLDSAGMHMLFQLSQELNLQRKTFAVVLGEDSPIATLLRLTNFQEAAMIYGSLSAGIAAARAGDAVDY